MVLALLLSSTALLPAPMLIQEVAINQDSIVFTYAGQLWKVGRSGGAAKRMFEPSDDYRWPLFSPDGSMLAYTKVAGGDMDIYVVPTAGGAPRQVTDHPKLDLARAWTPDGEGLLFMSTRERDGSSELYTVRLGDPMPKRVPVPQGVHGCFSPDGKLLAYTPKAIYYTGVTRRSYRGGSASPLWIVNSQNGQLRKLTPDTYSSINPMWVGDRIYHLSDRLGSLNLAVCDVRTGKSTELTKYPNKGITASAFGGGIIAYVRDGRIHTYDLKTSDDRVIDVRIDPADLIGRLDERATKQAPVSRFTDGYWLSHDGKTVLLEARGDAVTVNEAGVENRTRTSGVAERNPVLSPDGKTLAYFSDESGEYALHLRTLASGAVRKLPIEAHPTYYRELAWSPDGKRLCFSDQRLTFWVADTMTGRMTAVDQSKHMAQGEYRPSWSPDGRWLAYAKALPSRVRAIFLWDAQSGKATQLTDGMSHDEMPVFDASGRYLYFTSSANARNAAAADIGWALATSMAAEPLVTKGLSVFILRNGDPSPVRPLLNQPNPDASVEPLSSVTVDLEDVRRRIVPLPSPARDIIALRAGKPGTLILQCQSWADAPAYNGPTTFPLFRYQISSPRQLTKLVADAGGFEVSGDGSTVLYGVGNNLYTMASDVQAPTGDQNPGTAVDVKSATIQVAPPTEWRQIYHEAWRMMRDYFYDPKHHGQDVDELERHYAEYLPSITRRTDLNTLLFSAFGEISVSHLRVGGGDTGPAVGAPGRTGLLGAQYSVAGNRYRIDRILRAGHYLNQNGIVRAPLDQPGVDVREGDYLIEIDGQQVTTDKSINAYLVGKAVRPTRIMVSSDPSGANARTFTVVPAPGENALWGANWAERNRRFVEKASGGRLAYAYVPAWDSAGYDEFFRTLHASRDKQGFILDQRFNGGGITSDNVVEALLRKPVFAYAYRYGGDYQVPSHLVEGPKVILINEANGSAAETFPLMFKTQKVGTVVGKRTYGGGIGAALFVQRLIDGGSIAIPNRGAYNSYTGTWDIENDGIQPDVEVDVLPEDYLAGRDPQLEKAVEVALAQLKGFRKATQKRPAMPVHPGGGVR
jgi:tricorn protease